MRHKDMQFVKCNLNKASRCRSVSAEFVGHLSIRQLSQLTGITVLFLTLWHSLIDFGEMQG